MKIGDSQFSGAMPHLQATHEDKTASFAKNFFKGDSCHYPLLKGLGVLLMLGVVVVTVIFQPIIGLCFTPVFIAGVYFTCPKLKHFLYEISLIYTRMTAGKDQWMHQVCDKLHLGGILLNDYNHVEELKSKNIGVVISLNEDFERNSKTFGGTPVSREQLEPSGIEYVPINTPDYEPPSKESLRRAVQAIRSAIASGKNVYVHCKAGRGRSASAVLCYLLEEENKEITMQDVDRALESLRKIRPQVHLNARQKVGVLEYFKKDSL